MIRPDLTLHSAPRADLPKAREVRSPDECRTLLERYEGAQVAPIATESLLVPGVIQYSVPFARAGGKILSFCARKVRPSPEWCATGTYVEMCNAPAVERLARRAVEAVDCYGIGEVEILHEPASGRDCLIEINARPWVQYALAPASGHDFLSFVLSDGKEAGPSRKNDLRWIDFRSDFYVCFSRDAGMVRHKHLSWSDYVKSVLSANVYAKFNRHDLAPYWADTVEWMRFLARGLRPG
jgi:predicted ATP-grasp superfamily ATP-dependent carboligase